MKYKYHQENSRKGLVHLLFDLYGSETAVLFGRMLGLDPETPGQWISDWKRGDRYTAELYREPSEA